MGILLDNIRETYLRGAINLVHPLSDEFLIDNSPVMAIKTPDGKWFETSFYIGGRIKTVILDKGTPTDKTTITYDVHTRFGILKSLKASDLWEYKALDNVFLIKRWDGIHGDFFYRDITNKIKVEGESTLKWLIVPVEFKASK